MPHSPPIDTPTAPRPAPPLPAPGRRWPRWALAAALVAVCAWPIVAAGLAALDQEWRPTGDWAVLNLRVEDVGRLTPLVGPYSRYGWNHPGPLLYWLLAVPYHLLGGRPVALLAATAVLNAAAVVGAIALAWRRGGAVLATATAAALALVTHAMGPELLRDPWNPYVTVLALCPFVLAAWSIAEGDRWAWPIVVGLGSFLVQSHVGYVPVVAAVGGLAAGIAWARRTRVPVLPSEDGSRRLLVALTLGIVVVAWLPVAVDEVADSGNLGAIGRYFTESTDAPAGWDVALGQAARQLTVPDAPWLGDPELAGDDGAALGGPHSDLLLPVAAFALALAAAAAARRWDAVRFQGVVAALAVSGVLATSRITGPVFSYLVRWWWVVACVWWLASLWSGYVALRAWLARHDRAHAVLPWVAGALAGVLLLGAALPTARAAEGAPTPAPSSTAVLAHLLPQTVEALRGSGPVLVVGWGSVWGTTADAVRLELERHGIEVAAPPTDTFRLGAQRSTDRRQPVATVWVVSADAATEWRRRDELPLLASWDPLTPDERASYVVEEARLRDQLLAAGREDLASALGTGGGGVDAAGEIPGVDPELLARVEATRRRGDPVAVFVGPPTDPDDPQPPWTTTG